MLDFLILLPVLLIGFVAFSTSRDRFKLLRRFMKYELITLSCAALPFVHFGVLLGWVASTCAALILARVTEEELYDERTERKHFC